MFETLNHLNFEFYNFEFWKFEFYKFELYEIYEIELYELYETQTYKRLQRCLGKAIRIFLAVSKRASGTTPVLAITGMKLVSPLQRGTM